MTVQSSSRLSLASSASFYDWEDPFQKSLLKVNDEKSVLTEKRRRMVGDIHGARRPKQFITSENVLYLPASRHERTLKLRRLERKVLIWKSLWLGLSNLLRFGYSNSANR